MKLYTYDPAPNPRRVGLFLRWKGISLPTEQIDLRGNQQLSDAYRAKNPRCIVPALELDDGSLLCDAIAICWYLESRHPARPLLGTDPLTQARVLSWDSYIYSEAVLAVADALRNRSAAFRDRAVTGPVPVAQIPALEARGRQRLRVFWESLERELADREYLVGAGLTLADIDAFVVVGFAGWIKEPLPADLPRVAAWHARIRGHFPGE